MKTRDLHMDKKLTDQKLNLNVHAFSNLALKCIATEKYKEKKMTSFQAKDVKTLLFLGRSNR